MATKPSSNTRYFKTLRHELVQLSTIEKFLIRPYGTFSNNDCPHEIVACPKGTSTPPVVAQFPTRAEAEAGMDALADLIADPEKLVFGL